MSKIHLARSPALAPACGARSQVPAAPASRFEDLSEDVICLNCWKIYDAQCDQRQRHVTSYRITMPQLMLLWKMGRPGGWSTFFSSKHFKSLALLCNAGLADQTERDDAGDTSRAGYVLTHTGRQALAEWLLTQP